MDLLFGGVSLTGNRLLDLGWGVFVDRKSLQDTGHQGGAPRLAQFERRGNITMQEDLLYRHLIGLVFLDDAGNPIEDGFQLQGQITSMGLNATIGNMHNMIALDGDEPESGDAGTRIDTEDAGCHYCYETCFAC